MKKNDALRPEYDLSQLKGGVRGKYYRKATAGTKALATGKTPRGKAPSKRLKRSA